ncbi:MAG: hypothetical protein V4850_36450 [Myxococcota bacterium]
MKISPPLVMGCLVVGSIFGLMAAGGVFYVYTAVLGKAEAVVYNDGNDALPVLVDGVEVTQVPPHRIERIAVSQGAHVITTHDEYSVTVDGFATILVPTSKAQCLAEVDVSHLYEFAPQKTPRVVEVWTGDDAIVISEHTEFLRSSLPDEVNKDYAPTLMVPVPCEGLSEASAQAYVVENEARLF